MMSRRGTSRANRRTSGAPAFTPASVAGLTLWLEAGMGISGSDILAGTVSQWSDQSGNGRSYTQSTSANRPAYSASAINGQPALTFNGTSNYLQLGTTGAAGTLQSSAYTIVSVAKASATPQAPYWSNRDFATPGGGNVLYIGHDGSLKNFTYDSSLVGALLGTTAWTLNTPYVVGYTNDSANRQFYLNGSADGAPYNKVTESIWLDVGRIGYDAGTGNFWNGQIAEYIVYNRALTTAELLQLNRYLGAKYSIAVS